MFGYYCKIRGTFNLKYHLQSLFLIDAAFQMNACTVYFDVSLFSQKYRKAIRSYISIAVKSSTDPKVFEQPESYKASKQFAAQGWINIYNKFIMQY